MIGFVRPTRRTEPISMPLVPPALTTACDAKQLSWSRRWVASCLLLLGAAAGLVACGGGADRTKANLRFINASVYSSLDLRIDDSLRYGAVTYGRGDAYQEIDPDETNSRVTVAGSTTALVSVAPALVRKKHYSLVAWGREGELKTVLLDDDQTEAASGKASLRVINLSSDAGALDVYLTAETDALSGAVALSSAAAAGSVGSFSTVDSGRWRLRVTGAGDRSDLRLDIRGVTLDSRGVHTLLLTPTSGGVLVQALLLSQQGAISVRPVEHARVRVAAGLPQGGPVSVILETQVLLPATASPAVSAYQLVPAGTGSLVVSADGALLASVGVNLGAGTEHTLLVHAANGTASASWISENNARPLSSANVKLRLVNGLASSTEVLSLTASGLPVASGAPPGAASAGSEVAASAATELSVRAAGAAQDLYNNNDPKLSGNGVYTVFVFGEITPTVLLRADR
jgi:Domain of unknown function (DUF4397)